LNIYNYLKNWLIKNKRSWPKYIDEIKDKKKRSKKTLDFCRKIGLLKKKEKNKKIKKLHVLKNAM